MHPAHSGKDPHATQRFRSRRVLDAVHRQPPVQSGAAPVRVRQRHAFHHRRRTPGARRHRRAVVRQRRPRPQKNRRGDPEAGRRARLRAAVPDGSPAAVQGGHTPEAIAARRSRLHVFHQLGFRVGRHRAEDRARLSSRARRRPAPLADRARTRLSRRQFRRRFRRRHAGQPQGVRQPAADGGPYAGHPRSRAQLVFAAASPRGARISRTNSKTASSRCTMHRTSPP